MDTQKGQFLVGEIKYSYFKIELENAVEVFIYGEKERLGTVAVGTPLSEERRAISSTILGDRSRPSAAVAEAMAERFAAKTEKIAIVSCHLASAKEIEIPELLKIAFDSISL